MGAQTALYFLVLTVMIVLLLYMGEAIITIVRFAIREYQRMNEETEDHVDKE